ncbi:Short transient receptor hypothetical channel 4-associated protein, partial [Stegodyphus mimosarum]
MNFSPRFPKPYSSKNVPVFLHNRMTDGRHIVSSFQTLELIVEHSAIPENVEALFCVIKRLDDILLDHNPSLSAALQIFSELKCEIVQTGRREVESDNSSPCKETAKWIRNILLQHVLEVLRQFVMSYTVLPSKTAPAYESSKILRLKGIGLEIFHAICVDYEKFVPLYSERENFLHCLFSYLQYKETCFPASRVLESLLLSRKKVLDLSAVENLKELVINFEDVTLGAFCKILAITLSELDMYEHRTSLYAQTKEKKNENIQARDSNQDVVLGIPNILSRLVKIACAKPYVPWFPSGNIESEQWLQWIDDQLVQDSENEDEDIDLFIGGITQWSEISCLGPIQTSVQITSELTFRADAVCVLGLLLVGRHRKEVQKELAELQLIPQLSDLFDHFIWRSSARDHTRLPGHNSSCECSPEVALKIQVLRLIHSFCDHSDYKHVMLSWREYSELQALEETPSSSPVPPGLSRDLMCVGMKGLLSKIVEVMKKESGASTFRFWLSRAIESYLRGSFSSADQDFLLRRNLLQHVVGNLLASTVRHKEVRQSSFDLLGELIKFNFKAFIELNKQMHSIAKQKKLLYLMNNNLVDSNMFLRSLILSYESFASSDDVDLKSFAERLCFLLSHVGSIKVRVHYLQKLLSLINIHSLTQENVSCLNTALVILMFGLKKGELPKYLQILATNQDNCFVATSEHAGILDNLRDLLLFWQEHYLQKDKDCTILERSSRIPFQEWRDAVSLLTKEDTQNPCCIAFYPMLSVSPRAC